MDWLADPQAWIALLTLTVLELVLGIDNIVFITILTGRLPASQRARARRLGLAGAMLMRVVLLLVLSWVIGLEAALFTVAGQELSGRDLILLGGGLFLLAKATREIHDKLEGGEQGEHGPAVVSFGAVIAQIMVLDAIFSLDSVITAVGMAEHLGVMITAVVLAVGFMLLFAGPVGDFVERHPTVRMLALSFLLLVGVALVADGLDQHIPRGYIYFAMGFSVFVEMLNLRLRRDSRRPVKLRRKVPAEPGRWSPS
jgi:predicted tellurium resistance membrane protein TerC